VSTALITGASSGFGAMTARALAEESSPDDAADQVDVDARAKLPARRGSLQRCAQAVWSEGVTQPHMVPRVGVLVSDAA
jgi:NADP-dependent 3-hydroxy acid dehydrogenase YdfG